MNLFVVGWNLDDVDRRRAVDALAAMHAAFPLLDASTLGSWQGRRGFAAWMHHPREALGPRRYAHEAAAGVVLYDGTVVDPAGRLAAHDARELDAQWPTLADRLEGHFAAVRLDDRAETLELLNDSAGIHPTYVHRRGDRWWIANRVRLLAGAAGLTTLDVEGLATFMGMYWPGADRTFVEGVAKLPAAQHWRWRGDAPPERRTYWPLAELARLPQRRFRPSDAAALADDMRAPLRVLADAFGPLQTPVTAGRDTRMLTGLTMTSGCPADYFTLGTADDGDVLAAAAIAARFGLSHRRVDTPSDRLAEDWDEVVRRVVQRNDGMVPLMHARSALDLPERIDQLPVLLYGAGGELSRGKPLTPSFVLRADDASAVALMQRGFNRGGRLVSPEARQFVRDHIERTCAALLEIGFAPVDVPAAFELIEHGRRWAAAQAFQRADHRDVFVPFYTRPYVRAAFGVRAVDRLLERVPDQLLSHLSPELRAMPSGTPWPPGNLGAFALLGAWRRSWARLRGIERRLRRVAPERNARHRERVAVVLAQLPSWRERYLDRPDAIAWQVIDRERFEYLTSTGASDRERSAQLVSLYQAATVLAFEDDFDAWILERQAWKGHDGRSVNEPA